MDHLLYDCTKLQREREELISNVSKQDNWPVNKSDVVNKYLKHFIQFTDSIDLRNYEPINLFKQLEKNTQH